MVWLDFLEIFQVLVQYRKKSYSLFKHKELKSLYYEESKRVYCKCKIIEIQKLNRTDDKQVSSDRA